MSGFSEQRLIQRCLQKSHNHEERLGGIAEGGSLMTTLTSDRDPARLFAGRLYPRAPRANTIDMALDAYARIRLYTSGRQISLMTSDNA